MVFCAADELDAEVVFIAPDDEFMPLVGVEIAEAAPNADVFVCVNVAEQFDLLAIAAPTHPAGAIVVAPEGQPKELVDLPRVFDGRVKAGFVEARPEMDLGEAQENPEMPAVAVVGVCGDVEGFDHGAGVFA